MICGCKTTQIINILRSIRNYEPVIKDTYGNELLIVRIIGGTISPDLFNVFTL
jgi:hypothetical protein